MHLIFGSQGGAGNFFVVEVKSFAPDDLVVLVAFPGNEDEVATACFGDRLMNRFGAIGDLAIRLAGFF